MQFTELQMRMGLKVGKQEVNDGAVINARGGKQGDVIVSQLHGKYTQAVLDGNVYVIANQAPVTTTAVLTSTYTGLALGNPLASGKNLSILQAGFAQHAVAAAGVVGLMTATQVITASLIPKNRLTGGTGSVAVASAGFTISGTAILEQVIGSTGSLATTGWGNLVGPTANIDGSLMLIPGNAVMFYTSVITTSALVFFFMWEEILI